MRAVARHWKKECNFQNDYAIRRKKRSADRSIPLFYRLNKCN